MLDSLYNPDSMSKHDIKTLFVARQPLLDEIISILKTQPKGAGVQHVLIISPRGMGKTTMLLMVQFAIEENRALSKNWLPVRFPEENYAITDLADLWLKVLRYIVDLTSDVETENKVNEIETAFRDSDSLSEAAWALITNWSFTHKKRIALLVDNFDMILSQIDNEVEHARLRDLLMNDGTVMLIGAAPSYFAQITDYGQPLYNFFRIFSLNELKYLEIEELLRLRAGLDAIPGIDEILKTNNSQIKTLERFTGGNPRLVLMLYRIVTNSDMTEVRSGLDKLLDAVTPYYKDKTERLPAQQRKIVDQIVQYSLEKQEGVTPKEIAKRARMTPNQVSSQLKRLLDNGYVKTSNLRGRSSYYTLSEPLYVIWSQMRFGRNAREKRNWLVQILKSLFDVQEIQKGIERLGERVKVLKVDGKDRRLRGTLEFLVCLMETDESLVKANLPLAMESYLELNDIPSLRKELAECSLADLSSETVAKIHKTGLIKPQVKTHTKELVDGLRRSLSTAIESFMNGDLEHKLKTLRNIRNLASKIKNIGSEESSEVFHIAMFTASYWEGHIFSDAGEYQKAVKVLRESIQHFHRISSKKASDEGKPFLANAYALLSRGSMNLREADAAVDASLKSIELILIAEECGQLDERFETSAILVAFSCSLLYFLYQDEEGAAALTLGNFVRICKTIEARDEKNLPMFGILTRLAVYPVFAAVIKKANLTKELFHILVGMEYVQTKDENLLERLSPETRVVVDEMIKTLLVSDPAV